jgi:drug/metabolite transporter (DMT)-like permease
VFYLFAIAGTLAFAFGTFFTKGVTLRISIFKAIGPLFLLNAVFAIPFIGTGPSWKLVTGSVPYLHLISAISSGAVAYIIFSMISKSTASVSSVAPAMAPVVILLLSPIFLNTSVTWAQVLLVTFLMGITLYPLRNSISGLNSAKTIAFILVAALGNGVVAVISKLLAQEGVGMPETFVVRQILAGLTFTIMFPPIGLKFRDFYELVRRSMFMAIGHMTSIEAIQKGSPLVVQTFLSAIPITVIMIETVAYKKRPERAIIISSVFTVLGIAVLSLTL